MTHKGDGCKIYASLMINKGDGYRVYNVTNDKKSDDGRDYASLMTIISDRPICCRHS